MSDRSSLYTFAYTPSSAPLLFQHPLKGRTVQTEPGIRLDAVRIPGCQDQLRMMSFQFVEHMKIGIWRGDKRWKPGKPYENG